VVSKPFDEVIPNVADTILSKLLYTFRSITKVFPESLFEENSAIFSIKSKVVRTVFIHVHEIDCKKILLTRNKYGCIGPDKVLFPLQIRDEIAYRIEHL